MKTDELSNTFEAQKIYNNHKTLLDFIFENMPDDENKLRPLEIIKEIENRNCGIRFSKQILYKVFNSKY